MQAASDQPEDPGNVCGLAVGTKLWDAPLESLMPLSFEKNSPGYVRGLLGIYSLAENVTAATALYRHPEVWTPEFRRGLAAGVRSTAILPGTTIRLFDILRLDDEQSDFVRLHLDWLNRDGAQVVMATRRKFQEAFSLMQELRSQQFALMVGVAPTHMKNLPENVQKISQATVRAAHPWVLGTTNVSEKSLEEVDKIAETVSSLASAVCDAFINPKK